MSEYNSSNIMIEGEDYYVVNGYRVLTEKFLLARGFCCDNFCKNCPYKNKDKKKNGKIQ